MVDKITGRSYGRHDVAPHHTRWYLCMEVLTFLGTRMAPGGTTDIELTRHALWLHIPRTSANDLL